MARFTVTQAAMKQLRELRDAYTGEAAVLVLYWTGPQADSKRLPDGSVRWIRVSEGRWKITVDARSKYINSSLPLESVEDLEIVVKEFPQQNPQPIVGSTVDFRDGGFHVT